MRFLFKLGVGVSALISSSLVFAILAFLLYFSYPLFQSEFFATFFTTQWDEKAHLYGLMPMIVGTLYISLLATLMAAFMSFSLASLIDSFLPKTIASYLEKMVILLCGVPTVLYAFGALFLIVPGMNEWVGQGKGLSLFSASFVLSFVVLPTMSVMFLNAFRSVPKAYKMAAKSLGATRYDTFFFLSLPWAKTHMANTLIFGFARAVGDTLIALMLSGNAIHMPHSLFDSARTLTAHIALINANDYESLAFKAIFLSGLLLFVFTCCVVLAVRLIQKRAEHG